jgi:diguanylate cyclase (GGDEF)-like protein/PAS domain S-box-containing protein
MSLQEPGLPLSNHEEVSKLLDVLLKTGQRLEELTAGQVDTAADPEGRILLLRGTREQLEHSEGARQAAILNALPANIALLDTDGAIVSVNDGWRTFSASNMMGCGPAGQGLGLNYLEICDNATGAGSYEAHLAASGIRSVLDGTRKKFSFDYECGLSVEQRWFHLSVTPLSDDRSKGLVVMHSDVTASKRDQSKLVLFTERLSLATEVAKVGVWEWDLSTDALTWDATMFAIYGLPHMAMSYEKWSATVHPEDFPAVEAALQRAVDRRSEETAEFRIVMADGSLRHVSAAEKAVVDQSGRVCRVIGVNVDVTQRKRAEEALLSHQTAMTHLAEHDFLTGLPNQMVLRNRIDQATEMALRSLKTVAVLFLDLDGFKHINDSLGHLMGDRLLKSVARRLEESVRASDTVSRFGGDEFIVLLPDVQHPDGTAAAAARILNAFAQMHSVGQHELQVSACIGISVYPDDGLDGDTLIKNADAAMYQAKGKGGSNYQFFHPNMNVRAVERQFIEQNLRRALERNELTVHYQPKFDLKSRAITGVEALLRWTHPVRGRIAPAQFIGVAEDCGLILPIGMWVIEEACKQARAWLDAGLPAMSMAVNVSGRQFQSDRFHEKVMAVVDQTSMVPQYLELEVTESLLMKNPDLAASRLEDLRRTGIRVAIDDFGTGFSSLSYLQRFPIDTLKIDQSFVRRIDTADGVSIVRAIIQMGSSLGMRVVAEGVETKQEATTLENMGCEEAQGYHFGWPVSPQEIAALLERHLRSGALLTDGCSPLPPKFIPGIASSDIWID